MVMETEMPQNVGREFVRQYYTMLHEQPNHLFRFYSQDSSFVHGGVEKPGEEQPPTVGSTEIFKKIMHMDFHDCHAKIRQVDSQNTVGDAVVVQVTGELSNKGEPMRRFMQTFVLSPVAPKKYYVRNDIFRYQDEVFHDQEDPDADVQEDIQDSDSDLEDPMDQERNLQTYYDGAETGLSNGTVQLDLCVERSASPPPTVETIEPAECDAVTTLDSEVEAPLATTNGQQSTTETVSVMNDIKTACETVEVTREPEEMAQPSGPMSWAAMISKKSTAPRGTVPPSAPPAVKPPSKPVPATENKVESPQASAPLPQRQMRNVRPPREPKSQTGPTKHESTPTYNDEDRVQRSHYPDSQQLFVGALPHSITEAKLKHYFEEFSNGKVLELRINKKSGNPMNYGFVIFDDEKTVQYILANKYNFAPLEGHRINIEEKKRPTKDDLNSNRGPGSRGGMRGGQSRGRGYGPRGGNSRQRQSFGQPGGGQMRH